MSKTKMHVTTKSVYKVLPVLLGFVLLAGVILVTSSPSADTNTIVDTTATIIEGNTQYIDITAKPGGYFPKNISAKAGIKTVLRFKTDKSYGCETAMTIPGLNISKNLPPTGITEIEIGTQPANDLLITCLMRMYSATIKFS